MSDLTESFKIFDDVLHDDVAVAVSGGPDSMALCVALLEYIDSSRRDCQVHVFTVNHNLRAEAQAEAEAVGRYFSDIPHVHHHILHWDSEDVESRVQERAREARYGLISKAMAQRGLSHLFLGHHQDDQVETFLFRLAKGSGLDGLSCMTPRQVMGDMTLCRPFLAVPKSECISFCERKGLPFIQDHSNDDPSFARVRMRQSFSVLEEEGFSVERLSRLTRRISRAREALDVISDEAYHKCLIVNTLNRSVFNFKCLKESPEEVFFRVLKIAVQALTENKGYGLRMEKFERLCADFYHLDYARKQTMGGVIFSVSADGEQLVLDVETH